MKVCFETFGCRLSRAEALEDEAKYLARGWERTESHADAQLIVVRGCSVTARAQKDCERLIDHIKRKYPFKRVLVTGCLPSADKGYTLRTGSAQPGTAGAETAPPVPTRTARAYLKVQDGCSGLCTFCIVPTFRGTSVSVPFDEVLDKARRFIAAGYREIVVTGCNLSLYASGGKRLPELLAALAELGTAKRPPVPRQPLDGCRIRLGSLEPSPVASDVLKVMAAHPNVCRFLHIPVQSGSMRILTAMRRPYKVQDVDALVREARDLMPGIGIGCDLMTGFPDESDIDQLATLGMMRRLLFSKAHVFPYSERPGTVAAALPHAVPKEIRSARARELAKMADGDRSLFARRFKGRVVEIVVEDEKTVAGWTSEYLWCRVGEARKGVKRKDLVRILVREAEGHQLVGELV